MLKFSIKLLIIALFISGCSIKQDDSFLTKGAKHTANIPIYIITGLWLSDALVTSYLNDLKTEENIRNKQKEG